MSVDFECRLRVRSYELDSFSHVNHAVFLNYLEAARGEFLQQCGLGFADFEAWGAFPVVRRAELNYRAPLLADQEIGVTGRFEPLRRTGFRVTQSIRRIEDGVISLDAVIDLVFIDRRGRPLAVPDLFRDGLLAGPSGSAVVSR
jgi:YbgC/YbaW family acyl-CoA thioester hydrolase